MWEMKLGNDRRRAKEIYKLTAVEPFNFRTSRDIPKLQNKKIYKSPCKFIRPLVYKYLKYSNFVISI